MTYQLGYLLLLQTNITYYCGDTVDTVPLGTNITKRTPIFNLQVLYNLWKELRNYYKGKNQIVLAKQVLY